jgi:A/G-specific adenine glycosylase
MLQQTQVSRVLPAYEAWMQRWPDVSSLAAASAADVLRAWEGMGYNRRALNLHRSAVAAVERHAGAIPTSVLALRRLPGVGAYTAAAVASFAGGAGVPAVDTNVGRVLARAALGRVGVHSAARRDVAVAAERWLPRREHACRDHNLALMDIGAMLCKTNGPACGLCPLVRICAWRRKGYPTPAEPAPSVGGGSIRFEDTPRFARGRIVAALRTGPRSESGLASVLPAEHALRLPLYLAGLERDGLAHRRADGSWYLGGPPV